MADIFGDGVRTIADVRGQIMLETAEDIIRATILRHYPGVQGIYLFGSHGAQDEWPQIERISQIVSSHE